MRANVSETKDAEEFLASALGTLVLLAPFLYLVGLLFWLAGQFAAVLTGHGWPRSAVTDVPAILARLVTDPGDPLAAWPAAARAALGPLWLTLLLAVLFNAPVLALAGYTVRFGLNLRRRRRARRLRLGFASGSEIGRMLGAKAVLAKAAQVRPSLRGRAGRRPGEVGFYIGRDVRSRRPLYSSVEDGMVIVGPPRQGKDAHFCVPYTIDAPGAVIVTSTRSDVFTATYAARAEVGRVHVFDPQGYTKWPDRFRWSPILGLEDPNEAKKRADFMIFTTGLEVEGRNATNVLAAKAVLRYLLHAAAVADRTIRDVATWADDPDDPEPVALLRRYEATRVAAAGWADALEKIAKGGGAANRRQVYDFVGRAMGMFADPGVMDACSVGADEAFDLGEFVSGRNTLYLLGKEFADSHLGHLIALILFDSLGRARVQAMRMPGGRLDPPLTVELNEAAEIAALPVLPSFMVDLGGFSIAMHVYLQAMSQARDVWGHQGADALWTNATVRVVLGGGGHAGDLEEISRLAGRTDDRRGTVVRDVLTADEIRTLKFGRAVVLARSARPVEVALTPWWKRRDADRIEAGKQRTEETIRAYVASADADLKERIRLAESLDLDTAAPAGETVDLVKRGRI